VLTRHAGLTSVPAASIGALVELLRENKTLRQLAVGADLSRDDDVVRVCDALATNDSLASFVQCAKRARCARYLSLSHAVVSHLFS